MSEERFLLEGKNLSKSFGGVKAVDNVSLKLHEGEIVGIIGPNGSGKTTLVNLITGFVKKDSGKVFFKDKDITKWSAHKIANSGLTRTFQIVRPYLTLPAFKNIIPALYSPRAKRAARGELGDRDAVAIDILEDAGFERDAYVPYKLAGVLPLGYLKRLELCRCLALSPEVIICDELFSGLSMAEIATMLPIVERLQMDGMTLIMIEHRLRELFRVANRVIVMNFGEKLAEGTPGEVMADEKVKKAYLGEEVKEVAVRRARPESKALLEIENLSLFYENAIAINNISLKCPEGQITGIFGSNSAGKSSLMYTISGTMVDMKKKEDMRGGERITWFGKMKYNGEDILNLKPSERAKKGIILCPERRRIFPESSALENLKMGGYLASRQQARETLDYVFSIFPALKDKHILRRDGGFLSGGEQQMLAIGRALMAQPKLLLLDEPLLGLSPAIEAALARAIESINKQTGITVLIAEQYARLVLPIIDYGYVLENGSLVAEGTSQELMDNLDVQSAYFGT